MQLKNYLRLLGLCVVSVAFMSWTINKIEAINEPETKNDIKISKVTHSEADAMELVYDSLELDEQGLSHEAFTYAMNGFKKLDDEGVLQMPSHLPNNLIAKIVVYRQKDNDHASNWVSL